MEWENSDLCMCVSDTLIAMLHWKITNPHEKERFGFSLFHEMQIGFGGRPINGCAGGARSNLKKKNVWLILGQWCYIWYSFGYIFIKGRIFLGYWASYSYAVIPLYWAIRLLTFIAHWLSHISWVPVLQLSLFSCHIYPSELGFYYVKGWFWKEIREVGPFLCPAKWQEGKQLNGLGLARTTRA